jgi:hypothetical protein
VADGLGLVCSVQCSLEEEFAMGRGHENILDRRRRVARWLNVLVVVIGTGLAGCSGSNSMPALHVYEVKGKILLADGRPLNGGWVSFVPKGDLPVTPSSAINSDGTFSLVTGGAGEGAPAGEYKVRVDAPQLGAVPKGKKPPFPIKYADEDSSGLVVTVRAEPNHLEPIRLK